MSKDDTDLQYDRRTVSYTHLGISSGASFGATLAIMLGVGGFLGGNSVGVTAFIGAMVTSFAVIAIANMGGKATSAKLILAGMAVSAVCSAFSNFVIYITNDKNRCV